MSSLGGYVAKTEDWEQFERFAPEIYKRFGLDVLHTKDLHRTKGEFKNWPLEKKKNFVEELFDAAKSCGVVGVSACVRNSLGKKFNQSHKDAARISTLGLLFARVVFSFGAKGSFYPIEYPCPPLSLIVEAGNKNNKGLRTHFQEVRENGVAFDFATDLSFIGKKDCYAIQLADFWAFYSRRHGARILNQKLPTLEINEARPINESAEDLHSIAAYRCIHHLKMVVSVDTDDRTGGVRVLADSYTFDPVDVMYVPATGG